MATEQNTKEIRVEQKQKRNENKSNKVQNIEEVRYKKLIKKRKLIKKTHMKMKQNKYKGKYKRKN